MAATPTEHRCLRTLVHHPSHHVRSLPQPLTACLPCPACPQVRYPASQPQLPLGLTGRHFSAVFGANQSMLEALLLKRKIMGPCWVMLKNPVRKDFHQQVSLSVGRGGTCNRSGAGRGCEPDTSHH